MRHYKIAFCGLGSIAKRHILNVASVLTQRGETFEIDLYRNSLGVDLPDDIAPLISATESFHNQIPSGKNYDAVFVTNPTSVHYQTLLKFINHADAFFIEKPIFDTLEIEDDFFSKFEKKVCYVACPLRYNAAIQYIKENIDCSKAISVRAISSSYLPDWRPGQDYRKCYSARRELGGGVGIDLIHEWDYLSWLFGMPNQVKTIQGTMSELEIDSDDIAIYIGRNAHTSFEVHLDYFGRSAIRECDIYLPNETIRCDLIKGVIHLLAQGKTIQLENERNAYQIKEIEHFFDIINKRITNDSTAEHAFEVLKIAKGQEL
ncbi:Gfo/Idh/MocA family oxidoreductase [Parabacteroides sp.]|uniref:Gfo/Idh/MocA family oxidoreductase n=1 Tax=Parabacteroides sp. TaxID=1869337 RepID=UPI00257E4DC3|nr:Gfo/Idh/MocA family oxidoreductase [Parabacteroides sp.]